jgi:hypothetical protein
MREVSLSRGYVAIVDDSDYEAVIAAGPWHANPHKRSTYARRSVRRADFKGVVPGPEGKRWKAEIRFDGKLRYLGLHDTAEQAARMYDAAALGLFGEYALINFPTITAAHQGELS